MIFFKFQEYNSSISYAHLSLILLDTSDQYFFFGFNFHTILNNLVQTYSYDYKINKISTKKSL